jgi:hypothetical protein
MRSLREWQMLNHPCFAAALLAAITLMPSAAAAIDGEVLVTTSAVIEARAVSGER